MIYNLPLQYKGGRNYLHGSDIYNEALVLIADFYKLGFVSNISFKRFARNQCYLALAQEDNQAAMVAFGVATDLSGIQHDFWIYETAEPVSGRYPFDEDSIVRDAIYDEASKSISRLESSGYSPIEDVIALTKRLNYLVCPEVEGQWVFSQLSLMAPLANSGSLAITMRSTLRGRFSVNDIVQAGVAIGTIRFVVGKP